MARNRFVRRPAVSRKVLLAIGAMLVFIPLLSMYLGYLISTRISTYKNIMPDHGVIADAIKLNLSYYNTRHITVTFTGGLAAQMFQYASLYGIAKANGLRPFISEDTDVAKINEIFPYLNVERTKKVDPGKNFLKFREHRSFAFDQRTFSLNYMKDIELLGRYQSWRYFDHVRKDIKQQFSFGSKVIGIVQEFLHQSHSKFMSFGSSAENAFSSNQSVQYVGIHVRRGDILSEPNFKYGYIPAEQNYLSAAMQYFTHKFSTVIFVVTSDDLDWCRRNLSTHHYFVVFSTYNHPGLDLCLLSQCNHTVVTVGAFGWWAGWLAGGQTLYPSNFPMPGSDMDKEFRKSDYYIAQWYPL